MQKGVDHQNKERKFELERTSQIKCGRCKYNRGENAKRNPKPDKYKTKLRARIANYLEGL